MEFPNCRNTQYPATPLLLPESQMYIAKCRRVAWSSTTNHPKSSHNGWYSSPWARYRDGNTCSVRKEAGWWSAKFHVSDAKCISQCRAWPNHVLLFISFIAQKSKKITGLYRLYIFIFVRVPISGSFYAAMPLLFFPMPKGRHLMKKAHSSNEAINSQGMPSLVHPSAGNDMPWLPWHTMTMMIIWWLWCDIWWYGNRRNDNLYRTLSNEHPLCQHPFTSFFLKPVRTTLHPHVKFHTVKFYRI